MPRKHGFKLFKGKGRDRGSRWTYWDYEIWIMTILGKLSLPPQNEHKVLNRLGCSLHQNKAKDYDPTLKIVQSSSNKLYKTKKCVTIFVEK